MVKKCYNRVLSELMITLLAITLMLTCFSITAGAEVKSTFIMGDEAGGGITVEPDCGYGEQADGLKYGFMDIDDKSTLKDGRFDGFSDDIITYLKKGKINGTSYVTADYDKYDVETLSKFGEGVMPVRFSIGADANAYYTVTVTVVNTSETDSTEISLFSEKRHFILYKHTLEAGETITKTWNVNLVGQYYNSSGNYNDDAINIAVAGKNAGLVSVEIEKCENVGKTAWLLNDFTGDDVEASLPFFDLSSRGGVGQAMAKYINPEIAICNHGEGGLKSSDTKHFDRVVENMRSGDYMFVQYGFNGETTDSLKKNLPRYYNAAHEKGVKLVVVSTTERHSSQFWSSGVWKPSNANIAKAGKEFVEDMIENQGAEDIAFIDLNTEINKWMNTVAPAVMAQRQRAGFDDTDVNRSSMDYYYWVTRTVGIDNIHMNNAGADNGGYILLNEAKRIADTGNSENATKSERIQANVLSELVENMSSEQPYSISDDIVAKGWAPNDAYPYPLSSDVVYEYPIYVKDTAVSEADRMCVRINAEYDGNGVLKDIQTQNIPMSQISETKNTDIHKTFYWNSIKGMKPVSKASAECTVIDYISLKVQGDMQYYARGAVDIIDKNNNVIDTYYSVSTDINSDIDHIDNTACKYGEIYKMYFDNAVIPDECTYRAYAVPVENNGDEPVEGEKNYSSYCYKEDETDTLLLSEHFTDAESGWGAGGSATTKYNEIADKDGISALKTGNNGSGSYNLYKRFNNNAEVSSGIIKLHFAMNYSYGSFVIRLTSSQKTGSYLNGIKNIIVRDGELSFEDGTELGKVKTGKWTDIDLTLDLIKGEQSVSVAGGEPVTIAIDKLKSENAADTDGILPIRGFGISHLETGSTIPSYSFEAYFADIDIKTTVCDIPQYIITAQSDNEQYGTVSGSGKYAINSVVNLSANPKDGYECVGWYDNDNKLICDSEAYSLRVRDYKILYARFAPSSVIDTITSFSEDFENNANIFGISPNKKKSSYTGKASTAEIKSGITLIDTANTPNSIFGQRILALSGGKAVSAVLTTPVKLSDNQIFTLEFDCFYGYQGSSADAKAEITDSQKRSLVSYTWNSKNSQITDVKIGGIVPDGFTAFRFKSKSSASSGADGWNASKVFSLTNKSYTPHVTINIDGNRNVTIKFSSEADECNEIYTGQLNESCDISELVLSTTSALSADKAVGYDNFVQTIQ